MNSSREISPPPNCHEVVACVDPSPRVSERAGTDTYARLCGRGGAAKRPLPRSIVRVARWAGLSGGHGNWFTHPSNANVMTSRVVSAELIAAKDVANPRHRSRVIVLEFLRRRRLIAVTTPTKVVASFGADCSLLMETAFTVVLIDLER